LGLNFIQKAQFKRKLRSFIKVKSCIGFLQARDEQIQNEVGDRKLMNPKYVADGINR
jgi:hypothetical protein